MEPHKKESGTQNGNSSLQPSQGVLESGTVAVQSEASTISGNEKFNANQESMPDSIPGQVTHQPLQAPATQQPSKKKGFQITSVKDPGDGEESADELDESHTSYSDMSYSRTTDMDHDQESSASEDTLNTTVQDGISQLVSGQAPTVTNALDGSVKGGGVKPTAQNVVVNHSQTGQLDLSKDNEQKKDNVKSPAGTPAVDAKELLLGDKAPTLPQNSQSAQTKAPTKVVGSTSNTSHTTDTTTTTTSTAAGSKVTTSTSGSLAKGGASRVYKVVKRESFQPVKRERARWTCFDYLDAQSPNLVFVAHSASDTRLNYHEPPMHPANNLPTSMSATSVLSSSSSFNLQHSDSSSSIIRESFHNAAMVTSVQHSASTSSVNYDLENRKMQRLTNVRPLDETEEKRRLSLEERTEASGQDVIKSAIQSYVDLSTSEDEGSSTRSVRIDNKIEAAMDLVKKHLMLAVRDEVDELKEKIVELQDDNLKMKKENDLLKGVLTPEQQNAVQQVLSRAFTQPQKSTSLQPSQTTIPGYNLPIQGIQSLDIAAPTPNQVTPTQQPLATGQANPTIHHGYAQQPAANTGNIQLQPMHLNPALITAQGSIPILQQQPQQQGQQQPPNATLAQKPGALAAITTVQSQFQQTQSLYQPVSVTQQAQLTQQQVQALLQQQQQQQQVYPQAAAQQGYQAQTSTPTVGSQQPVQASQHLPTQATTYQGQPGALAGSYAPTQTPFPPQQPQTRPVAQSGTALGMPRQQQQQQQGTNVAASITSPTNSGPTLNQPQQTFQASTPTHVTNPASTYSTFIQTSAATSGGKPTEPRVTQS